MPQTRSRGVAAAPTPAPVQASRKRKRSCETVAPQAVPAQAVPAGWGSARGAPPGSSSPAAVQAWFDTYARTNEQLRQYMHDEWGFEKRGDQALFEKLCLEGAQAGLSWATILAKREEYRAAFHGFDIARCARMTDADVASLLESSSRIVKNRAKVASVPANARAVQRLIDERAASASSSGRPPFGFLDEYLWSFVGGKPVLNSWPDAKAVPATSAVSDQMSAALKAAGLKFVGPTICYSFMQSCGLVIDHPKGTPQWEAARARLAARERT